MRTRIMTLISTVFLVGAALLSAQTPTPSPSPQPPATGTGGHMMSGSMMAEKPEGGSMMDDCKAMMAKRQAMMDEMKAMDAKLDALVRTMNEAEGSKKVDATAAVVTELVGQRKMMGSMMESMHPMMMQHMMKHMQTGMMESMGQCPMMQGGKTEDGGHEKHH